MSVHVLFHHGRATSKRLLEPIALFLAHLRSCKYSPATVTKREDDLRKLAVYLEALGFADYHGVTLQTLEAYRCALAEQGYSPSVLESAMRCAKLLFTFLTERGMIFENPAKRLKVPRPPKTLGTVLTREEVQCLLAVPDLTRAEGLRDRAILETLYSTGMRRAELTGLAVTDVDLDHAMVRVTGKGRKQRKIPLGKHAVKFIRLYLKEARPKMCPRLSPAPDALWLTRQRKALPLQALTCMIIRYGKLAKLDKEVNAHTLRRTCATHLLNQGAHPVMVALLLGHACLRSLSHYLQVTVTDLMKAHAQSKPGQ